METSQRLSQERIEGRNALHLQLETLQRQEQQLEDKRRALIQERKRLWSARNAISCSKCQNNLNVADGIMYAGNSESQLDGVHAMRGPGDGQNNSAVSWLLFLRAKSEW